MTSCHSHFIIITRILRYPQHPAHTATRNEGARYEDLGPSFPAVLYAVCIAPNRRTRPAYTSPPWWSSARHQDHAR